MRIEWLTEVEGSREYAYVPRGGRPGSLVVRDPGGDTMLPPYSGRFTVLEDVTSREDAIDVARVWAAQHESDDPERVLASVLEALNRGDDPDHLSVVIETAEDLVDWPETDKLRPMGDTYILTDGRRIEWDGQRWALRE